MKRGNYGRFLLMLLISFLVMYCVMYANVASEQHIFISLNRFYMTILMVMPMAVIMLLFMKDMYRSKTKNNIIIVLGIASFIGAFILLRTQTYIDDINYMKSMIPHHSSAILSSQEASLNDPEVKELSKQIIESQEREIKQMKEMINRLENE